MPDAAASRKRQIQIAPKPLEVRLIRGAGASRPACRDFRPDPCGVFAVRLLRAGSKIA
jgi:hypothetical protein